MVSRQSAFSQPLFRRYFPSSCLSTLGSWTLRFLIGWSAWELTQSAMWVGVVAGLMLLPTFVLSPVFGIVSDRINPRNGLLVTAGLHGLIALLAALVNMGGGFSLPWLLFLATMLGGATSAHTPIRLALVPLLVPREALPSAIGTSAVIFNTSRILGPALGAWLLSRYALPVAFLVSFLLFAGTFLLLLTVRIAPRSLRPKGASLAREFSAGLAYVRSHRAISLVLAYTLVNGLLGRTVLELLPALSGQLLDGSSTTLATLTASAGAGSIIGGLVVSRQGSDESQLLRLITACLVAGALTLMVVRWLEGITAFSALVLALSMITTMVGTGSQALAQLLVAEDFRGRVLSLWTVLAMGAPALGAMIMGTLADQLGFPAVLIVFAVTAMIAVAMLFRKRHWLAQRGDPGL